MEKTKKHSKKRDAILACIRQTKCHPTADWIYQQLKPEIPDLSLGTVYRNLSLFKEQGLITSLGTVQGIERFDGNVDPHVHFICSNCDAVIDLHQIAVPQELSSSVAETSGCYPESCQLTFTGLCSNCQD